FPQRSCGKLTRLLKYNINSIFSFSAYARTLATDLRSYELFAAFAIGRFTVIPLEGIGSSELSGFSKMHLVEYAKNLPSNSRSYVLSAIQM
ncbi:hypothetical protein, partial [[Flexibacter] sp. ATCC 35208]|uniref:hypothetical protein n=1 Tax=[Flexibacter] sp. ATCC 35208 TaxID=1936242 RepID=UPI001C6FCE0E